MDRVASIAGDVDGQTQEIERIGAEIQSIRDQVDAIARSLSEQERSSSDIARHAEEMQDLGAQVRRGTEDQRSGSRRLLDAMEQIRERVAAIHGEIATQVAQLARIKEGAETFAASSAAGRQRAQDLRDATRRIQERSARLEADSERFRV